MRHQSLTQLLKVRRALPEPEVRYFMHQLLEGCRHVHSNNIIHRDIKLGNLLLDRNMELKICDFGLATHVRYEGEKKVYVMHHFNQQVNNLKYKIHFYDILFQNTLVLASRLN